MARICYKPKRFNIEHRKIIDRANTIISEYAVQGFDLTLRQLYYQFVRRIWLENNKNNYKMLGNVISDARRAGEIDWDAIVDRTRYLRRPSSWNDPSGIIATCAKQFTVDFWKGQKCAPEVWVEKDALVGVLEVACEPWHVPYFSCRGYTSDSEAWAAGQRIRKYHKEGRKPYILHLGDHDPSGIDMTRDIQDRLNLFTPGLPAVIVRRIALNSNQIEEYNLPPNPAKATDARFKAYQSEHGDESWELDALEPTTIAALIRTQMERVIDQDEWARCDRLQAEGRRQLAAIAERWGEVERLVNDQV